MKKLLIFIGCLYLVFFGDYHVSNYIFKQYCADKNLVGQFIHERKGLSGEFFMQVPLNDVELRKIDKGFFIDEKKVTD